MATVGADGQTRLVVRSVAPEVVVAEQGPVLPGDRRNIAAGKLRKIFFSKGRLIEAATASGQVVSQNEKRATTISFKRSVLLPLDEAAVLANDLWERSRRGESAVQAQVFTVLNLMVRAVAERCDFKFLKMES